MQTIKKVIKKIARIYMNKLNVRHISDSKVLRRILGDWEYEMIVYRKFGVYLTMNFGEVCRKTASNHKAMIIRQGMWSNTFFSAACLNNTLGLILYSLSKGCVPIIEINADEEERYQWDWFFKQPADIICPGGMEEARTYKVIECDIKGIPYTGGWDSYLHEKGEDFIVWSFLYKTFVSLNEKTRSYITQEEKTLAVDYEKTLGVLVRGTDYVSTKPKYHPIQPDVSDIVKKAEEYIQRYGFTKIYLATEEERIYQQFADHFGKDLILVNKREYYDGIYKEGELIGRVHFNREHDNYWRSIEYLSSLVILSRCKELCAGNCGGAKFAMLYSDTYERPYVFDLGYY